MSSIQGRGGIEKIKISKYVTKIMDMQLLMYIYDKNVPFPKKMSAI